MTAVSSSISKKAKAIEYGEEHKRDHHPCAYMILSHHISAGADHFVVSSDPASVAAQKGTLDLILNTVPTYHDYMNYQSLLTTTGLLVCMSYVDFTPWVLHY